LAKPPVNDKGKEKSKEGEEEKSRNDSPSKIQNQESLKNISYLKKGGGNLVLVNQKVNDAVVKPPPDIVYSDEHKIQVKFEVGDMNTTAMEMLLIEMGLVKSKKKMDLEVDFLARS
jgi:hypothetical protein